MIEFECVFIIQTDILCLFMGLIETIYYLNIRLYLFKVKINWM